MSDGSAAAIICRAEDAHKYCDNPLYVKALSFVAGPAAGPIDPGYDYTTFDEVVRSAADAYAQAGITDPRVQLAMAEVHDCFTPTELVLMEDLGFAERGTAWKEVLAARSTATASCRSTPTAGSSPSATRSAPRACACCSSAGSSSGARPRRTARSIPSAPGRTLGLTHNLGGAPGEGVSFVGIVGTELG